MVRRFSDRTGPSTLLCACSRKPRPADACYIRVLVDDVDYAGRSGGGGFAAYGIDPKSGAIVVVRPDGYVGTMAPLDKVEDIDAYFSGFML